MTRPNSPSDLGEGDSEDPMERLRRINANGRLSPLWSGKTVFGRGAMLGDESFTQGLIWIADKDRSGHLGCFGTTQIGKTRMVECVVEQDIRKGYSTVVIDPKGDQELFSKFVQVAAESGRLEEVMVLTPIFPDYSIYLDPLSDYYMEDELVNHIISGLPGRDSAQAEYYTGIAAEVSQVVVSALIKIAQARGEHVSLTFDDIKKRIGHEDLRRLRETLSVLQGTEDLCRQIDQITQSPGQADFFNKVSSSLRTTLSMLTFGNTGRIIGKARTNEFIQRLESGKRVLLYCTTGSLLTSRVGYIVAKVFVSMIQSLVGRLFARDRKLEIPLCLHLDEGHNVLYPGVQEIFNKGGGANVWIHLYTQSIAQIEEEAGAKPAHSIMDSINTWVYMRVNHPQTAAFVMDTSPIVARQEAVIGLGASVTMRGVKMRQVQQEKVLELPKRSFYLRSHGKFYKGETLNAYPPYVRVTFPQAPNAGTQETPPSA